MPANEADKGILGEKLGMTQVWDDEQPRRPGDRRQGRAVRRHPGPHPREATATPPSRSPTGSIDPRKVNKPTAGHFAKAGVPARRHLVEIRTERRC